MGFLGKVGDKVRNWSRKDKENSAKEFAKGATMGAAPVSGYDMLQAYGYDVVSDALRLEHDLLSRFVDYEEMDESPELASALDVYADDATQIDSQLNRSIWLTSKDKDVENLGNHLFHRTLRLDEDVWEIARTLCKYGNDYEELLVNDDGVRGLNFLAPPTVRRVEGPRGELYGFVQDHKGRTGYSPAELQQIIAARAASSQGSTVRDPRVTALEDWEVVHFRLRGKQRRSVYGFSVLEAARWIWKRLTLLEDAALIYRLQRSPERFAFYVDVGEMPPKEALAFVRRARQQYKKKKFINPTTGKVDLKHNVLAMDEDFWIPSRNGRDGTRVEVVGGPSWQHMDDVQYFQNKMFAAIKVPKAYFGQEEGIARAVLSSEDVRFARTILRVQQAMRGGFSKVMRVHMAAKGLNPSKADYEVHMTTPSSIFELAQLEVRNARADLASRMREHVSLHWVLSNVFQMGDSEIETILEQRVEDTIRDMEAEGKGQAAAEKIAGGPGGSDGPGPEGPRPPKSPSPPSGELTPKASEGPSEPGSSEEGRRRFVSALLSERGRRNRLSKIPITERELFRGDREAEKRAEDKLNKLLKQDRVLSNNLREIKSMMMDLMKVRR